MQWRNDETPVIGNRDREKNSVWTMGKQSHGESANKHNRKFKIPANLQ